MGLGTLGGPPGGQGQRVQISSFCLPLLIRTLGSRYSSGPPSVPSPILLTTSDSYRQNSVLNFGSWEFIRTFSGLFHDFPRISLRLQEFLRTLSGLFHDFPRIFLRLPQDFPRTFKVLHWFPWPCLLLSWEWSSINIFVPTLGQNQKKVETLTLTKY